MRTPLWLAALAAAVVAAIYVEWHTDEVTVVLAVLLLSGAALGAAKPSLAPVAGAVLGFSILAAHALTEAAGTLRPGYMHSAPAVGDWAAMALAGLAVTAVTWGTGMIRARVLES
jgi:hypothetical protein